MPIPPLHPHTMKIKESQFIHASSRDALNAAERWLKREAPQATPERGVTPEGLEYVGLDQLIDGIEIITRFTSQDASGGSWLTFTLQMRGQTFPGKLRNLGMLPARKHVRHASREQFSQIVAELEDPSGEVS